jgi:hypothetical protein
MKTCSICGNEYSLLKCPSCGLRRNREYRARHKDNVINQARLKELYVYDNETGIFTAKVKTKKHDENDIAGWYETKGYLNITIDGKSYKAHRLAWLYVYGCMPSHQIDHINHVRDDNRLCNLREATHTENMQNSTGKRLKNGFPKGAWWDKRKQKWKTTCQVDGIVHQLGFYESQEEALKVYREFAKNHHGEFFYEGA